MKNMKWFFCGAGILLLTALVLAGCGKTRGEETADAEDGGVVNSQSGDDAPKEIGSTEISRFRCESSQIAVADPGELGNYVYTFEAERKDGTVFCTWERYGRGPEGGEKHSFETDGAFLDALQKIVAGYDLAQYNGFYHSVSGLPGMYGDFLSIEYASGETIYAKDNQDSFLPPEAVYDFLVLFGETGGVTIESGDIPD